MTLNNHLTTNILPIRERKRRVGTWTREYAEYVSLDFSIGKEGIKKIEKLLANILLIFGYQL